MVVGSTHCGRGALRCLDCRREGGRGRARRPPLDTPAVPAAGSAAAAAMAQHLRLHLRPLAAGDAGEVRAAHTALFPVDYEDAFYSALLTPTGGVYATGAFDGAGGLAGFVTARLQSADDVDPHDAGPLGLDTNRPSGAPPPRGPGGDLGGAGPGPGSAALAYLLTLGVAPPHRGRGLAKTLVATAIDRAVAAGAGIVYLHVATFNRAAAALYASLGFATLATLPNFYHIATGRQPDPDTTRYSALLLAKRVGRGAAAGWPPPAAPGAAAASTPPPSTLDAWLTWAVDAVSAATAAAASLVLALAPAAPPPQWAAALFARGPGRRSRGERDELSAAPV